VTEPKLRLISGARAQRIAAWTHAAWLALSIVGAGMLVLTVLYGSGADFLSYWRLDFGNLYENTRLGLGGMDAFRYSPPIAVLMAPLGLLPFDVARLAWLSVGMCCLALVARRWTLAAIALYPVALELSVGNIYLELTAAIFLGFRWPALWSFVLLTKVTPGIGLLWFVVRREWRSLGIALGATAAIAAASLVLAPALLREWIDTLIVSAGQPLTSDWLHIPAVPLLVRLPAAALLVTWGARTDRRWTVAAAATLALPTIWPSGLAMLVGAGAQPYRSWRGWRYTAST
jgi:hypothetical protein